MLAQPHPDLKLSENALTVLERRYLRKDENRQVVERPQEMFWRVARAVAEADRTFDPEADVEETARGFYQLMVGLDFLPNSPTLMNAGAELGQLSACFVLPVADDMTSIFEAVKNTALIHQSGGGTGFAFSRLRPAGDVVKSTGGVASGPISFMRVFDAATETIKQGGTRRGANMSVLRVDHPDIMDFITCKAEEGAFSNFNISVGLTDKFMQAVEEDGEYELINPRTGQVTGKRWARETLETIAEMAYRNGEPGIIFLDRMNEFNPTPALGRFESTNPCGEQILLAHESCNLGSINLAHMVVEGAIDWARLERTVKQAVHFLDNVITVNKFPLPAIREATLRTRKIGLGVMGFADMLVKLALPYDSEEAESVAETLMEVLNYWSKVASIELAVRRGRFPTFEQSIYAEGRLPLPRRQPRNNERNNERNSRPAAAPDLDWDSLTERIRREGLRNASTVTVAPTGSISIIAGVSSGIEPFFALVYTRNILDDDHLLEINPLFEQVARERGFYSQELMQQVAEKGSIQDIEDIPADVRRIFVTAHDVSPAWHIRMQAAYQRHTDSAISKTINLPHQASVEDVRQAYMLAYQTGCKGLTLYRDGSRDVQVWTKGQKAAETPAPGIKKPRPRPTMTHGLTEKIVLGCNRTLYVTINEDEVGMCEVFLQMGKCGGCTASQSEAIGRLISLALRSGIETKAIVKQLKGIRCPSPSWHNGGLTLSCSDAIAKSIERYLNDKHDPQEQVVIKSLVDICPECPECGGLIELVEGCAVCRLCGYSRCG